MTDRHRKGWISPANLELTPFSTRLPDATIDDLREAATLTGKSQRQILREVIHEAAVKARAEHRPPSRRRTSSPTPRR
jgi:hypothetical protein